MAKKPKEAEKDTSERWLLTYSDLMNLLLILFIILYCASNINAAKAAAISQSMQAGFGSSQGNSSGGSGTDGTGGGTGTGEGGEITNFDQYDAEILKLIKENNLQDKVSVEMSDAKVAISFTDNVLFEAGSAELNADAVTLIHRAGDMMTNLQYSFILVEGYTDSDPIHNDVYKDNMDLSTQRAANVWRELRNCGLSPDNMASIGYGEYRPLVPNDCAADKAKNRRVVITIIRSDTTVDGYITNDTTEGTDQ